MNTKTPIKTTNNFVVKILFLLFSAPLILFSLASCDQDAVTGEQHTNMPSATSVETTNAQVDETIDQLLGDHMAYLQVFKQLKMAVAANDSASVAAFVDYPIGITIDGNKQEIVDEREFIRVYSKFMTPEIKTAITNTAWADILVNSQGIMLGNGEAWINGICNDGDCQDIDVKVVTLQPGS